MPPKAIGAFKKVLPSPITSHSLGGESAVAAGKPPYMVNGKASRMANIMLNPRSHSDELFGTQEAYSVFSR